MPLERRVDIFDCGTGTYLAGGGCNLRFFLRGTESRVQYTVHIVMN